MPESNNNDTSPSPASGFGLDSDQIDAGADALKVINPDAGEILGGATKGPIGLAAAIASVIKEHLETEDKDFDQMAEDLARPIGASTGDYDRHAHEAKLASAGLESDLANAGTNTDPIGTRFQRVKSFLDGVLSAMKREVEAKGRLEEAQLRHLGASPDQILAAQKQTRAKLNWLDGARVYFDGSGLLRMEQFVRNQAQSQLKTNAEGAKAAQLQAKAENDDLQSNIRGLKNATGKGELREYDPAFIADQKRIEKAEADLKDAERETNAHIMMGIDSGSITPKDAEAIRSLTQTSDQTTKTNFTPVNTANILASIQSLAISNWNFKARSVAITNLRVAYSSNAIVTLHTNAHGIVLSSTNWARGVASTNAIVKTRNISASGQHIGPMAQDWNSRFGGSTNGINVTDAIGVLIAGEKELAARVVRLSTNGSELPLKSPNGTVWYVKVSDAGQISASQTP